ncbi:MAG: decaprenyl-phosphate phosphoribosyltransferase [Acidobacteria bacterium]|nr:decaprenyl-phosphate phosphoribosyltransferase [Acidobacteriota bacterium]
MRPAQWIKNGFVLAPLVFSARLAQGEAVGRELAAFGAFCLSASGVYLLNDTMDWREDQVHPTKRSRPIPSGRLSPVVAAVMGVLLMLTSVLIGFVLNPTTGLLLSSYLVINVLYSLWLKHVSITDLMCIALGFVFRVMAGASALDVQASHWLLICTFLLALFLGIGKRRHEILLLAGDSSRHRKVLVEYSVPWLDQAGNLLSGAALVSYALYTVSPETQARFGTDKLFYTLPFVVYGILRYLHLIHAGGGTGNPTSALTSDWQLLTCVTGWLAACAAIIYF